MTSTAGTNIVGDDVDVRRVRPPSSQVHTSGIDEQIKWTLLDEQAPHALWANRVGAPMRGAKALGHHNLPVADKWIDEFVAEVFKAKGWDLPPLR